MVVFVSGEFLPEEKAVVPVFDRGFLYGDGLFETMRLYRGRPFCWDQHLDRLKRGANFLDINPPYSPKELRVQLEELVRQNGLSDAVLRIVLSRGVGPRGYSPHGADRPVLVMSLHPVPARALENPQWRLVTSSFQLRPDDPLANYKTCNKLHHVLARAEAEARGGDEPLLLTPSGEVAETASCNLFWIEGETVCTTPLGSGALPGVTRAVVLELCRASGLSCQEKPIGREFLFSAAGVFLTSSVVEVIEVLGLDGRDLARSPLTPRITQAYRALLV